MRRLTKGIVTLAAAAGATLAPVAAAGPALADQQNGLVNVYAEDIASGNQITLLQNVSIPVVAAVCGVNVNVLSNQLKNNQPAKCPAKTTSKQIAWVSYH